MPFLYLNVLKKMIKKICIYIILYNIIKGSIKSASAPPRGGAREPGSYLSIFHQQTARANVETCVRLRRAGAAAYSDVHDQLPPLASASRFQIRYAHPISLDCRQLYIELQRTVVAARKGLFSWPRESPWLARITKLKTYAASFSLLYPQTRIQCCLCNYR